MRCDKCVGKPHIRGLDNIKCYQCGKIVLIMIGNVVCHDCSETLHYCEKCGDKLDKPMEIEYNI